LQTEQNRFDDDTVFFVEVGENLHITHTAQDVADRVHELLPAVFLGCLEYGIEIRNQLAILAAMTTRWIKLACIRRICSAFSGIVFMR